MKVTNDKTKNAKCIPRWTSDLVFCCLKMLPYKFFSMLKLITHGMKDEIQATKFPDLLYSGIQF